MSCDLKTKDFSRRDLLKLGLCTAAASALPFPNSALAAPRRIRPRAKSVIQIWMWGGPAHLDTFDPKPGAGYDYTGPLNKPISTNVSGIRIGQMLPLLAKQADKYSIIRSMTHGVNAHETASYLVQTGTEPGRIVFPCAGAVVSLFKGYDAGYSSEIPPYIVLTEPQGRFSEAGFLANRYKPFATGGNPNAKVFAVEGIVAEGISDDRQRGRRDLLHSLDSLGRSMGRHSAFKALDRAESKAYRTMFGETKKLFDLSTEGDKVRDAYGRSSFGQSCLMARRLVEQGVPYITINYKGWDTHKRHFQLMNRQLPEMDQGLAALISDLDDRGLLESTIVWWGGEFGRTPKIQWEPPWNGGRGHYGACFSAVVAGGGFKGGEVVGESDERGESVVSRPVAPRDVIGSIYQLMGINPDSPLPNDRGMNVNVLPPLKEGDRSGGRLYELMKA